MAQQPVGGSLWIPCLIVVGIFSLALFAWGVLSGSIAEEQRRKSGENRQQQLMREMSK